MTALDALLWALAALIALPVFLLVVAGSIALSLLVIVAFKEWWNKQ